MTEHPLPDHRPTRHYGHCVWDDEDGEAYYLAGHVPVRRAIAAVNRYCRTECGLVNLSDDHGAPIDWVTVRHVWWKPAPDDFCDWEPGAMTPCSAGDQGAEPFTEVTV